MFHHTQWRSQDFSTVGGGGGGGKARKGGKVRRFFKFVYKIAFVAH